MEISTAIAVSGFFIGVGIAAGLFGGLYYTTGRNPILRKRKTVDISYQGISSLKDYFETEYVGNPDEIQVLDCSFNGLTSLEGCPRNLEELWCAGNQINSLKGCPENCRYLNCSSNNITTLDGISQKLEYLYCTHNKLKSLVGCPQSLYGLWCGFNDITSFEGLPGNVAVICYKPNPIS